MTKIVNGLHSCKPENDPIVGQIKTFFVEQRTGKSGKPWIKIKSAPADQGGQPYRVISAEQTDFEDNYGNHSWNVTIEPADMQDTDPYGQHGEVDGPPNIDPDWPEAPSSAYKPVDDRQAHIERQHSQEMALRFFALGKAVPTTKQLREMISWFQRDISHSPDDQNK